MKQCAFKFSTGTGTGKKYRIKRYYSKNISKTFFIEMGRLEISLIQISILSLDLNNFFTEITTQK